MSFQAITTFFQKVAEDAKLERAVQAALDERAVAAAFEIVDIARAQGCDFTATELREYLARDVAGVELSEEQMGAVAGGLLKIRALGLTGLRAIGALPLDELRKRRLSLRKLQL
jgi:predicted ribosomally synthesized peptide with nif11-like leader